VIKSDKHWDEDQEMVVVAYVDNIIIATKGSVHKHHRQVSKVFQLLMNNNMCIEINKCKFHVQETTFPRFILSRQHLTIDPGDSSCYCRLPQTYEQKRGPTRFGFMEILSTIHKQFLQNGDTNNRFT
jgi:hypothetical protein